MHPFFSCYNSYTCCSFPSSSTSKWVPFKLFIKNHWPSFFPLTCIASPLSPANSILWRFPGHGALPVLGSPPLILSWSYQLYINTVKGLSCYGLPPITWLWSTFHRCFNLETHPLHITDMVIPRLSITHYHDLPSINQECHPPLHWCSSDLLSYYWCFSNLIDRPMLATISPCHD